MDNVEAHFDSAFIPPGGSEVWFFVCSEEFGVLDETRMESELLLALLPCQRVPFPSI